MKITITYGFYTSPFGKTLIGAANGKLYYLAFSDGQAGKALADLKHAWPDAELKHSDREIKSLGKKIFSRHKKLPLAMNGTDFQIAVWQALTKIPKGKTATYGEIAKKIGKPKAFRAVGTACGNNNIAYVIPCHRVVGANGSMGGYRWGLKTKTALLKAEHAIR